MTPKSPKFVRAKLLPEDRRQVRARLLGFRVVWIVSDPGKIVAIKCRQMLQDSGKRLNSGGSPGRRGKDGNVPYLSAIADIAIVKPPGKGLGEES